MESNMAKRDTSELLINNTIVAVSESLMGLACINPEIELIDIGNVIVRKNLDAEDIVLIVSGGASGLEPAYAQYVGKGMLSAAVQGDLLLSPPVKPILRTIRELGSKSYKGILLIVSGRSGDLLNFGVAAERSKKEGLLVKMVSVFDHHYNFNLPDSKKKGLSGAILVYKIAGAMAEAKKNLQDIYNYCNYMGKQMISLSFSLQNKTSVDACTCKKKTYEIGRLLTGDSALKTIKKSFVRDLCKTLLEELFSANEIKPCPAAVPVPMVLLLNNVGGVSKLEELIVLKELLEALEAKELIIARVYCGSFFSSTYFDGFVITLMKVFHPDVLTYLDAPTSAMGWKQVNETRSAIKVEPKRPSSLRKKIPTAESLIKGPRLRNVSAQYLEGVTKFVCEAIISCERQMNLYDSESGNGNTGTRLRVLAEMLKHKMHRRKINYEFPYAYFRLLSKLCESLVGGPMGSIFSIFFESAANSIAHLTELDENLEGPMWLEVLKDAAKAIQQYGGASKGDGTMYDPLIACAEETANYIEDVGTYLEAFGYGVRASEKAIQQIKKPCAKYTDPGAHAVGLILKAIYEGMKL